VHREAVVTPFAVADSLLVTWELPLYVPDQANKLGASLVPLILVVRNLAIGLQEQQGLAIYLGLATRRLFGEFIGQGLLATVLSDKVVGNTQQEFS
jgi:hypothetical protein